MEVRRSRDDDEVEVGSDADLLGGRDAGATFLRESGGVIDRQGRDGHDLHVIEAERAVGVHRTREPRTEDAHAQWHAASV
jgi:hypothetical protein